MRAASFRASVHARATAPRAAPARRERFPRVARARPGAAASAASVSPLGVDGGAYARELAAALDAVRLASELCAEVQGQLMRMDEQAETKEDRSLVTLADYAAQAIISWCVRGSSARGAVDVCLGVIFVRERAWTDGG